MSPYNPSVLVTTINFKTHRYLQVNTANSLSIEAGSGIKSRYRLQGPLEYHFPGAERIHYSNSNTQHVISFISKLIFYEKLPNTVAGKFHRKRGTLFLLFILTFKPQYINYGLSTSSHGSSLFNVKTSCIRVKSVLNSL